MAIDGELSQAVDSTRMAAREPAREDHEARSAFVRGLVQRASRPDRVPAALAAGPRRKIVQFWDDLERLPDDVSECIESWRRLEQRGFEVRQFDAAGARD